MLTSCGVSLARKDSSQDESSSGSVSTTLKEVVDPIVISYPSDAGGFVIESAGMGFKLVMASLLVEAVVGESFWKRSNLGLCGCAAGWITGDESLLGPVTVEVLGTAESWALILGLEVTVARGALLLLFADVSMLGTSRFHHGFAAFCTAVSEVSHQIREDAFLLSSVAVLFLGSEAGWLTQILSWRLLEMSDPPEAFLTDVWDRVILGCCSLLVANTDTEACEDNTFLLVDVTSGASFVECCLLAVFTDGFSIGTGGKTRESPLVLAGKDVDSFVVALSCVDAPGAGDRCLDG